MKRNTINGNFINGISRTGSIFLIIIIIGIVLIAYFTYSSSTTQPFNQISQKGSDTLLVLAQRWAEAYQQQHPEVIIAIGGGGSGTGFAALINKQINLADSSREIKQKEIDQAQEKGINPVEWKVAIDGIIVIVHKDNPIEYLTLDQLKSIYNGSFTRWKEVGEDESIMVTYGRQSNSGTYIFWHEFILKKDDYRSDMQSLNGNADIVEAVINDRNGIGYVGVAYAESRKNEVKIVPIKIDLTSESIIPTHNTISEETYPISRFLYIYTDGIPTAADKEYLKWIIGSEGQKITEAIKYIPLPVEVQNEQLKKLS